MISKELKNGDETWDSGLFNNNGDWRHCFLAHLQLKEKKTKQKIIWEMPTLFCIKIIIICAKIFNWSLLVFWKIECNA